MTDQKGVVHDKRVTDLTAKELKALIKEAILEASRDKERLQRKTVLGDAGILRHDIPILLDDPPVKKSSGHEPQYIMRKVKEDMAVP